MMVVLHCVMVVLLALTAWAIGRPLVSRLAPDGALLPPERVAVAALLGAQILYLLVYAVGVVRLDSLSMAGVAGAALVAGMLLSGRPLIKNLRRIKTSLGNWDTATWSLAVLTALVATSSMLQGLAPPNDYDSLNYHLSLPILSLEQGRILPVYDRGPYAFFPPLLEHLFRFWLAVAGERSVQMVHGLFGISAALSAAGLAMRLGGKTKTALLAALLFFSVRMVVWEMASCEVDVGLSAYAAAATSVVLVWHRRQEWGLAILIGLLVGGAINTKYHGLSVALALTPVLLLSAGLRARPWTQVLFSGLVALAVVLPHIAFNWIYTNNPVYPLFNTFFNPQDTEAYGNFASSYGIGRGITAILLTPWYMFIDPMTYFDGMVIGSPYLLALLPVGVVLAWRHRSAALLVICALYYLQWFFLQSQQVRFLLPIFPMLAAMGAAAASWLWSAAERRETRWALIVVGVIFSANQAMFVGIYGLIRLPVALGLVSPADFHNRTPTMKGAYYGVCVALRERIKPGERYVSMITPNSSYCPQLSAIRDAFDDEVPAYWRGTGMPKLNKRSFLEKLDQANVAYFVIQTQSELRRTDQGIPVIVPVGENDYRFLPFIADILPRIAPLAEDPIGRLYDGRVIRDMLRQNLNEAGQ